MTTKFISIKKYSSVSQFTAVSAFPMEVKEKVFLKASGFSKSFNVSDIHTPLCLRPLLIGIILRDFEMFNKNKRIELSIVNGNSLDENVDQLRPIMLVKINLQYFDSIEVDKNIRLILFKVNKSRLFLLSKSERFRHFLFLYLHYLKRGKRNSILFLKNLAALYTFPRKVVLNVIKTDSHFNIFPMDLVCELYEDNILILGLNVNNRSVEEIIHTKKMLIVEPSSLSKDVVYNFAGNHKKEMIESDFSKKYTFESEIFHFPIPDFACSYKEISCFESRKLGSHFLLICRIINKKILKPEVPLLYHISTIYQSHLEQYNNPNYSVI